MDCVNLSIDEQRYKRHVLLPQVGVEGQEKIQKSKVLVIGAGGLGSPVLMYLAAAGVGTIGIVDFDRVDISNLQRQILYTEKDVGCSKAEVAKERLLEMNSKIQLECIRDKIDTSNIQNILSKYDIIVDATDNFDSRYIISDACIKLNKPEIYGAIYQFCGQIAVFGGEGPCLRCLKPMQPKQGEVRDSRNVGVLGAVPGIVGTLQAAETLKCILNCGDTLKGRMIFLDILNMKFQEIELHKNNRCPVCGKEA